MVSITINGITISPSESQAEFSEFSLESDEATESDYILITTNRAINEKDRSKLSDMGVELLEKVPESTFVAKYLPNDLQALRDLDFVEWANIYLRQFKIAPELLETDSAALRDLIAATDENATPDHDMRLIEVVLHERVDLASALESIARIAGVDAEGFDPGESKLTIMADQNRLARLAKLDVVHHMEPFNEAELFDDEALRIMEVNNVHNSGSAYRGKDEIVAVCDTGFDKGSTSNVHSAFAGRVKKLYALGRGTANDPHGHGTHVAGSVLADGQVNHHGPVSGTAPDSELILQAVLDNTGKLGGLPGNLNNLFSPTYSDGARVHNNSWGTTNSNGNYSSYSRELDEFVWNNRDMVVCFAAGNPGRDANANGVIDLGSVQAPGTAKNCITVGASENLRVSQSKIWATGSWANKYPAAPIAKDLWADNPDGMAAFSGRGPTKDGRIKPDVVAPGTSILSAQSRDASTSTFWGVSPDADWSYKGGTSMATPLVSGCVAVIREYLRREHGSSDPSAALLKALLINGCKELPGQYVPSEAGRAPNFSEGFGRVSLERTIDNDQITFHEENRKLDTGQNASFTLNTTAGSNVKVTLVWTDPPGASLQNDLDLIVRHGTEERHGNMPTGSGDFDRVNNVEQVWWDNVPGSQIDIIVHAHDIGIHLQNFALVIRAE